MLDWIGGLGSRIGGMRAGDWVKAEEYKQNRQNTPDAYTLVGSESLPKSSPL